MSKYLFISSHTDDHETSCGGAIQRLLTQGHEVTGVVLSYCDDSNLMAEWLDATEVLDLSYCWIKNFKVRNFISQRQEIADYFYSIQDEYDFVFTHSSDDKHPDHRTVGEESLRIFKCNILTYTGPWNGSENSNYFVELTEEQLEKKIQALACYKSQAHRPYMDPDFIRAWARYNGIRCGKKYAEGFHTQRLIV